jgi:hypothetical protein
MIKTWEELSRMANKIPKFTKEIPKLAGYYWWKESMSEPPEIIQLEISSAGATIDRVGDDRPTMNYGGFADDMGLFSDKIPNIKE